MFCRSRSSKYVCMFKMYVCRVLEWDTWNVFGCTYLHVYETCVHVCFIVCFASFLQFGRQSGTLIFFATTMASHLVGVRPPTSIMRSSHAGCNLLSVDFKRLIFTITWSSPSCVNGFSTRLDCVCKWSFDTERSVVDGDYEVWICD